MFTLVLASAKEAASDFAFSHEGIFSVLGNAILEWMKSNSCNFPVFGMILLLTVLAALAVWVILYGCAGSLKKRNPQSVSAGAVSSIIAPTVLVTLMVGVDTAFSVLEVRDGLWNWLEKIYASLTALVIVWGLLRMTWNIHNAVLAKADEKNALYDKLIVDLFRRVVNAIIWIAAIFFIAQNIFEFNISAMLAGAGVIGLAIAFAAQNTIANIFGAVAIILDKPFSVGDRIVIGGKDGIVESVGLRSTLLRSLGGTLFVIPNKEMSDTALENLSRKPNFKQIFNIRLVYSTPPEKMERAVALLHEILDGNPYFDMKELPPQIYFDEIKDWALNICAIVWFRTTDYFTMLAEREKVNFAILKKFNAEGLEFAFPSSTTYLAGDAAKPVLVKGK